MRSCLTSARTKYEPAGARYQDPATQAALAKAKRLAALSAKTAGSGAAAAAARAGARFRIALRARGGGARVDPGELAEPSAAEGPGSGSASGALSPPRVPSPVTLGTGGSAYDGGGAEEPYDEEAELAALVSHALRSFFLFSNIFFLDILKSILNVSLQLVV